MGRVREYIKVGRRACWTLFDSGAENTYVLTELAEPFAAQRLGRPRRARLGGKVHTITHVCLLQALVKGKPVDVEAYVMKRIGMDPKARRPFEILFGALAMQKWGIELELKRERLDMSRYPHEFVEF